MAKILDVHFAYLFSSLFSLWCLCLCVRSCCTDQFTIDPKGCWCRIMLVESFDISKIILLNRRTLIFNKLSPTLKWYLSIEFWAIKVHPLQGYVYIKDNVLGCRQWLGMLLEPLCLLLETCCVTSLSGHLHHDHHKRNLTLLKQFGLKRLHSWIRISSQTDTCQRPKLQLCHHSQVHVSAVHNFVMAWNVFFWKMDIMRWLGQYKF